MKALKYIILGAATATLAASCSNDKNYSDLLNEENRYVNAFLADQKVETDIPADTVFKTVAEYGSLAPYYRLDEDGMLYMQVVEAGTKGNMVKSDEQLYIRFDRYALSEYKNGTLGSSIGNNNVLNGNLSFRYDNYSIESSYTLGAGIQAPLQYLPVDAVVNIVVKSQWGMPSEMSYVQPYLYKNLKYYRPKV